MIGGEDHVFPYAGSPVEGMRVAVRAVLRKWPHALFENAADGSVWDAYHKLPLSVPEVLVYRDANAYALWE